MNDRIGFCRDRLRWGEWLLAGTCLAILVDVLALPWYSLSGTFRATSAELGAATSASAVQAHAILAPFALLCAVLGIAVWGVFATRAAPALGVTLAAIATLLDAILVIGLLIRVVVERPAVRLIGDPGVNTIHTDVAAVLGVLLAISLLVGAWRVLSSDGIAAADAPRAIETLTLVARPS